MISIFDNTSARAVLDQPLRPPLRSLITDRLHDAEVLSLSQLTHLVVIEPNDTESMMLDELGWSPLANPIDGHRFGSADFIPYWSWLQDLGGWYELIHTVGNEGFAYILLVENAEGMLPALRRLCQEHGDKDGQCG